MSTYEYTLMNTECDWCEEIKSCRGLEDHPGNVVLTICEGCDHHPEFPMNINQKENTAMTITTTLPICDTLTSKGCNNTGSFILEALVSGNVARKSLTEDLVGGNWTAMDLHVCKTHLGMLNKGKAVSLKSGVNTLTTYDLAVPEQRDLFSVEVLGQETTNTPKEGITMDTIKNMTTEELEARSALLFECGAEMTQARSAYETEAEFLGELAPITAELEFIEKLLVQRQTGSTKTILCGHCKGYHGSPAEVAACYGVDRKTDASSKPLMVSTFGYNRQWFETKKEAIAHLKTLSSEKKGMESANNGHGVWVWSAK